MRLAVQTISSTLMNLSHDVIFYLDLFLASAIMYLSYMLGLNIFFIL